MSMAAASAAGAAATTAATTTIAAQPIPSAGRIVRDRIVVAATQAMYPGVVVPDIVRDALFDMVGLAKPEEERYKAVVAAEVTGPYKVPAKFQALIKGEQLFSNINELFVAEAAKMMQHFGQMGERKTAVLKMTADAVVAFANSLFSGVPYRNVEVDAVVATEAAPLEGGTGPLTEQQGMRLRVVHARSFERFEQFYEVIEGINPLIADVLMEQHRATWIGAPAAAPANAAAPAADAAPAAAAASAATK